MLFFLLMTHICVVFISVFVFINPRCSLQKKLYFSDNVSPMEFLSFVCLFLFPGNFVCFSQISSAFVSTLSKFQRDSVKFWKKDLPSSIFSKLFFCPFQNLTSFVRGIGFSVLGSCQRWRKKSFWMSVIFCVQKKLINFC